MTKRLLLVVERRVLERRLLGLEADLAVTSQRNDETVQQAMTDKRSFGRRNGEKVVATYGN